MNLITADSVRQFLLSRYQQQITDLNLSPETVPDDFDFFDRGIIDSFGILELIAAVEEEFSVQIDYEGLDADSLTVIGPFCRYVEEKSQASPGSLKS